MAECTSPLRGPTLKEYDQQIAKLKNENFNLKLRIFMLEEHFQHKFGDSLDDVQKVNFELQLQVEILKRDLINKNELLLKASAALESLEVNHKTEINKLQQRFAEQLKAVEQLQFQDPSTHSVSTDESQSHRDEFYEQAFLPLQAETTQTSKEMELEAKLTELQKTIEENQTQMLRLHKELSDRDRIIHDEEVNSLKRNKVLQGLVAAVKTKDKELKNIQEKFQQIEIQQANSKDDRKERVKGKSLEIVDSAHSDSQKKTTIEEFQKENERLQLALQDALNQKDAVLKMMQFKLDEQLKEKDEIINQMRESIDHRDAVLNECLRMVGISNTSELPRDDVQHITEVIRLKLDEKEKKSQLALEQKIKMLKESENEVIQLQARIGDLENSQVQLRENLERMQEANMVLHDELNQRDVRMKELLDCLHNVHEELKNTKERHSIVMHEKDSLIQRLELSYVNSERELQETHLSNKENVGSFSSDFNNLQNCISEKDKLIEELITDKNKSFVDSERSFQNLSMSLRDKDNILTEVHDRLVQEQNVRVMEREQMLVEIGKKSAEIKNLENHLMTIGEQHQTVISKLQVALEEKDKTIKSLVETNEQKAVEFQMFVKSCQGTNVNLTKEIDLKSEVDALNKELTLKHGYILSVKQALQQLTRMCSLNNADDEICENALIENIRCLEQKILNVQQQTRYLNEMFKSANKRIRGLRSLVQKCSGVRNLDGSGDTLMDEKDALMDNVNELLTDVKLIINHNEMLERHIKLSDKTYEEKRKSSNSEFVLDMTSPIQQLKAQAGSGSSEGNAYANVSPLQSDKLRSSPMTPKLKPGFIDTIENLETKSRAQLLILLQEANTENQTLKNKLSSTENTVHHLGSKVKDYRKRLSESGHVMVTPTTPTSPQLDVSCYPTPPSCHTDQETSREGLSLVTRRSVSAEDIRSTVPAVAPNDQALSVDDVLNTVASGMGNSKGLHDKRSSSSVQDGMNRGTSSSGKESRRSWRNETEVKDLGRSSSDRLSCAPYSPDSVNEFGRTDDVLELKEQIYWLKLRFEEHVHEPKENKKNELEEMPICANAEIQTETLIENESAELAYLQQQNSILHLKLDTLLAEIPEGQHATFIQLQRQELHSLRSHLCNSHHDCELLRIRLEELAEFLEQLLQFDENGLLDLSRFTPQRIASLQLQIAQSRELSINLSQSLMMDGDLSMISSCVESTHLYDPDNVTLTDNDGNVHANQSIISSKSIKHNEREHQPFKYQTSEKIQSRDSDIGPSSNMIAKEPQWKKCVNGNLGKHAQSSYDDLILLLDTSVQEQFRQIVDKKQSFVKPADDVRNLASEQEQAIHEYVRRDSALQHKLDKVHQSLKDNYQLMAGDVRSVRSGQDIKKHRAVISPTDSESWSEPDRDVSQQRMGIEPEFYSPGEKGSLVRSPRSVRLRSLRTGSSNTEESVQKPPSGRKSRSNPAESWQQLRIQHLEEINASLRSELKTCHSLLNESGVTLKDNENSLISVTDARMPVMTSSIRKQLFVSENENNAQQVLCKEQLNLDWHEVLQKRLGTWIAEEKALENRQYEHANQVSRQTEMVQSLQKKIQVLREKLHSKDAALQEMKKSMCNSNEADHQLKETNQRLQNSLSQLQTALKDKDSVCQELREANVRMQNLLDVVDKLVGEKDDQLVNLEKQRAQVIKEAEEKIGKLKERVVCLTQLLKDANRCAEEKWNVMIQTHANEVNKIQQEHENSREAMSRKLNEMELEVVQAKQVVDQMQDEAAEKEEKLKILQVKFDEMSAAILETEKHMEVEHGKHLSLQEKVNTLNKTISEKDKINASMKDRMAELENARNVLDREHANCGTRIGGLQTDVEKCQREATEKDHQIGMLRQIVDKMQEVILEKKSMLERQLEKARNLEEKVEILSSSATEKEQRCQEECTTRHHLQEKLRTACEAELVAKSQATSQQKSCSQLKDSLAVQEKKYLDLQNKLDERGDVIRKLEEELHQSWEENERLQQQIISVQTTLHETNNLNKSMKTELQVYEHLQSSFVSNSSESKELPRTSQDISELFQEIRSLRTQLELSIQTSCALRQRLEQQLSCQSAEQLDKREPVPEDKPCKEMSSQSTSCSHLEPIVKGSEGESSQQENNKILWGEQLQQSQHFSKISSNSIESGQFSDIDVDKQERDSKKVAEVVTGPSETIFSQKMVARKKRPTNLVISKQGCMSGTMDLSAGANDLHSVYSSPDLGIESDPSQFSYLEQRLSTITDKHLWEIRTKSNSLKGLDKDDLSGSGDMQLEADRRLLYAIGRLDDYELLRKELEEMAKLLNQVHVRIVERVKFAMTTSPVKDVQQVTWKDVQSSINNVTSCLQKSLNVVGSFWTAVLPSENRISEAEFEKITQTNNNLRRKIRQQKKSLQEALQKLAASNRLKDGMEKAIMKQLSKTHEVLKKAKGNLEDHTKSPSKLT